MDDPSPKVVTIFGQALECASPEEHAAYLQRACQGDPALRARVEGLLQAHGDAGNFLRGSPRTEGPDAAGDFPSVQARPGMTVGPYKLLEQIGEGGFAVVFMAEQQHPVRRRVAVKVLKAGMDSR